MFDQEEPSGVLEEHLTHRRAEEVVVILKRVNTIPTRTYSVQC